MVELPWLIDGGMVILIDARGMIILINVKGRLSWIIDRCIAVLVNV